MAVPNHRLRIHTRRATSPPGPCAAPSSLPPVSHTDYTPLAQPPQPSDPLPQLPCFALDSRRRRIGGVVSVGQAVIVAQSRLAAESVLYLMSSLSGLEPDVPVPSPCSSQPSSFYISPTFYLRHGCERLVKSYPRIHFESISNLTTKDVISRCRVICVQW
jgi:hypothetical protein